MPDDSAAGPVTDPVSVIRLPTRPRLSAEDSEWVAAGLVAAMPGLRMRELLTVRPDLLADADYLVAAVDVRIDRVVGVLASQWAALPSGRPCLHIQVQFVGDAYRSGSIFRRSWALHFAELVAEGHDFPEVVVLKTYNPVAYCAINAFSGHPEIAFYPAPAGPPTGDPELGALAAEVARTIAPRHRFDPATGVIHGVGNPRDLYAELPSCSVQPVNDYFTRSTHPGDRVLCVLHVPTRAGRQAILAALGLATAGSPTG